MELPSTPSIGKVTLFPSKACTYKRSSRGRVSAMRNCTTAAIRLREIWLRTPDSMARVSKHSSSSTETGASKSTIGIEFAASRGKYNLIYLTRNAAEIAYRVGLLRRRSPRCPVKANEMKPKRWLCGRGRFCQCSPRAYPTSCTALIGFPLAKRSTGARVSTTQDLANTTFFT